MKEEEAANLFIFDQGVSCTSCTRYVQNRRIRALYVEETIEIT